MEGGYGSTSQFASSARRGGAVIGLVGVYGFVSPDATAIATTGLGGLGIACSIKGNISVDSGERIYHVPGQRYHAETTIRSDFGERYFCSEVEARAAGWRKSRV